MQRAVALLAAEFARSGVGHLEYEPQAVEAEMTRDGALGGHHIGTECGRILPCSFQSLFVNVASTYLRGR